MGANQKKATVSYAAMSREERLKQLDRVFIKYPQASELLKKMEEFLKAEGRDPLCLFVTGETGAGKTRLCERHVSNWERGKKSIDTPDGIRVVTTVPVLFITCPTKATEKSIVETLLQGLGDPKADKGTLTSQTHRFCHLVKQCEIRQIVIDEIQHFYDRDGKRLRSNVANFVKELIIRTGVSMVLTGMPEACAILDDNRQLNRRFKRASLDPLRREPEEKPNAPADAPLKGEPEKKLDASTESEFTLFLATLDKALPFDRRSFLADEEMSLRLHEATGGTVDKLMRLVKLASAEAIDLKLDSLNEGVLAKAYEEELAHERPGAVNPFSGVKSPRPKASATKAAAPDRDSTGLSRRIKERGESKPSVKDLLSRR